MTVETVPRYRTWLFDCDGVILDSNRVKTNAFRAAAKGYGNEAAEALVAYHVEHGGVSRFAKFEYFLRVIVGKSDVSVDLTRLLDSFAEYVSQGLRECSVDPTFLPLLAALPRDVRKLVVSGGVQSELRELFRERRLDCTLDAIYGSPDTKHAIIERGIAVGEIGFPAVFVGDSRLDYEVAATFGMDFIFVRHWTDFKGWEGYFAEKEVRVVDALADLLPFVGKAEGP